MSDAQGISKTSVRRGLVLGLVISLLALLLAQAVLSMRLKVLTYDENYYLPAGYSYLTTGDFRMITDHPPLIPLLSGLPLLLLDVNFPADSELWKNNTDKFAFGSLLLYGSGNDADAMAFWGRMSMVSLSILLAVYVFLWAEKLYGTRAGFLGLFLYVFSPNMLAYSRLVTPDFGVACFMFIACYHLRTCLENTVVGNLVWAGVFTGCALATSYSAFLLFPVFLLMLGYKTAFLKASPQQHPVFPGAARVLSRTAIVMVVAVAIIFAAHMFREDALQIYVQCLKTLQVDYWAKDAVGAHFVNPDYRYYLNGEFSAQPWWYYSLVVFLVKTPISVLILLVAAVFFLRKNKADVYHELWLIVPVFLTLGATFFDVTNLGLRRILTVYPFLFVFVSKVAAVQGPAKTWFAKETVRRPLLLILAGWYLAASLTIFPDYLSYFNAAAGGPRKGLAYLDDSNVDWGQDLKGLKAYMVKHKIPKIKLLYFGTSDANYYQINWQPILDSELYEQPLPGYYAISAHILVRLKLEKLKRGGRDWLEEFTPLDVIGHTIYIYKF
ncbi:MAG: ArnT family glycosyltransferase [Nitrospinales bacterium]